MTVPLSDYEMLKAYGHSPAKAAELVLDAGRGDPHCQRWIALVRASGIETEGHDRAAGRGAEHESPTAESGDAQNIGGPSQ